MPQEGQHSLLQPDKKVPISLLRLCIEGGANYNVGGGEIHVQHVPPCVLEMQKEWRQTES